MRRVTDAKLSTGTSGAQETRDVGSFLDVNQSALHNPFNASHVDFFLHFAMVIEREVSLSQLNL